MPMNSLNGPAKFFLLITLFENLKSKLLIPLNLSRKNDSERNDLITFCPLIVSSIIDKIISVKENNQKHIKINGDGMQTRSFMYIEDFVEALCLIYSKGENKNIYHLGVTEEVTIKELIDKIQSKMGTELSIVSQDAPSGETKRRCPDVSKLAELGFIPKYNLDRGLSEII